MTGRLRFSRPPWLEGRLHDLAEAEERALSSKGEEPPPGKTIRVEEVARGFLSEEVGRKPGRWLVLIRDHTARRWRWDCEPSDVLQEACKVALEHLESLRGSMVGQIAAWFRSIVLYTLWRLLRHSRAQKRSLERTVQAPWLDHDGDPAIAPGYAEPPSAAPGPEEIWITAEEFLQVMEAIAALGGINARLIYLVDVQRAKLNEAAVEVSLRPQDAKGLLWAGRQKLRSILRRQGIMPSWRVAPRVNAGESSSQEDHFCGEGEGRER